MSMLKEHNPQRILIKIESNNTSKCIRELKIIVLHLDFLFIGCLFSSASKEMLSCRFISDRGLDNNAKLFA